MAKRLLLAAALAIIVFAGLVMMQPEDYQVERSTTVFAPSELAFDYLTDFHNWSKWSPWEHLDPNMTKEIGGAETGVGATYYWKGNDEAGEGKMTITEVKGTDQITMRLDFIAPFESTSTVRFKLKAMEEKAKEGAPPPEPKTKITWSMEGKNHDFASKAFSMLMDMDELVGSDYQRGLANLKGELEKLAKEAPAEAAPTQAPEGAQAAAAEGEKKPEEATAEKTAATE